MTSFVTNISSIMEKFTPARGSTKLDEHEHDNDNTTTNATMAGRSSARSTKMLPSPSATPSSAATKSASKTKPARQSSAAKPKGRPRAIASTKVTTTTKSKPKPTIPQTSTATRPRRTAAAPTRYTPPTFHAPASRSRRGYHKITAILEEDPTDYFVQWAGVDPRTKEEWLPEWVPKKAVTAAAVEEWRATLARREKKARRGKREEVKAKKGTKAKKAQ